MRRALSAISFAAVVLLACQSRGAAPPDPKTLYTVQATATPQELAAGEKGTYTLAIKPKGGAYVKAETPFRGKLSAAGSVTLEKVALGYADHARIENRGPIFEVPFTAKAPGQGAIDAELVFFVCVEEACLRTTEKVTVPVLVR